MNKKIFSFIAIALLLVFPLANAQEPQQTFVYDNAGIIKDPSKLNTALQEINKRLNVKFIIETGSIENELQQASSLIERYLEQSTFAKRKFSTYGLDDRYDTTGTPALNLLIYYDPKFKGIIIDSENCGYKDDAINIATNNNAVANELRAKNYDNAFLILINELSKLAEERLSQGVDCVPDFEEENPKADELILISTLAQFDPNFEAARLRMTEAAKALAQDLQIRPDASPKTLVGDAKALAQDLQAKGKISNAANVVHKFNLQAKKLFYGRELAREAQNLELKLEALRNKVYEATETPILEYYEDEAEEESIRKEMEGVKFVFACVEKGLTISEIQSNPNGCIDESIIDKIGSLFTPVLFASGKESVRTYAEFSKDAFRKNVALNMLYFLEQATGEKPEDRLCAAYANAAASLHSKGLRFRAAEAYTYAQIYCKGASNPRYKSIPADSEQIIAEIERGNAIDAVWGTTKGLSSPINVAVIGSTIILTVAAPPVGGALAGARGAAIAQEVVVGAKIGAGVYFTGSLAYSASENAGLCIGQGIDANSKDCVAALTEAGMALMIAKSGPKHVRELKTAHSLRVQVESLEARLKELNTLNLQGAGNFESIRLEIAKIETQLEFYKRLLSNPSALAIADQLKKQSKQSDIRSIIDQIADQMVVDAAQKQASVALQLTVSTESADVLIFVQEIKKADGRFTKEQALLPATPAQKLIREGQPAGLLPAAPVKINLRTISTYSARDGKILTKLIEDRVVMDEVIRYFYNDVNGNVEIAAKPTGRGGHKNVYRLDVSAEVMPTKSFVVKVAREYEGSPEQPEISEEEFYATKEFGERNLVPKIITQGPTLVLDEIVIVQEYAEGMELGEALTFSNIQRQDALKATGELHGRLFFETTTDGISAIISEDSHRRNVFLVPKNGKVDAIFIERDPQYEVTKPIESFFYYLFRPKFPRTKAILVNSADTRYFLVGFVKQLGSPDKAIKLLQRIKDHYSNPIITGRNGQPLTFVAQEANRMIAIIRNTGSLDIRLAPTQD